MSNLISPELVNEFRRAKSEEIRFTYNEINYSTLSSTTAQVGYGYRTNPYTSAVTRDYDKEIVIIPSTVTDINTGNQYTVTKIGDHAFYYCSKIKRITIPYSVEVIGWSSLAILSLEEIIIPPNSRLKDIRTDFIHSCFNLSNFVYPNNEITISREAFSAGFYSKFYYCGNQKVTTEFSCGDHCPTIYVPKNYPYSSFGNLDIFRDDFCVARKEATCFRTKQTRYRIFMTIFILAIF